MEPREIVVGVSGGIAAYKTAYLVSQLVQADWQVRVAMTPAATRFVGAATFAALSGHPVALEVFDPVSPLGAHIELAQRARLLVVAPATADLLARAACGLADDIVTTLLLCFSGPVLLAPAMNCQMWAQPAVRRNVQQLERDGRQIIDPEEGWLSCRTLGAGRMAAPERILAAITAAYPASSSGAPWPAS